MGVDDDALTLATQETSVKTLVYIMNIQEENKGITKDAQNDGKNPSEQDDKKPTMRTSPLEKSLPINRNDDLKDYGESGIDNNLGREKEWKMTGFYQCLRLCSCGTKPQHCKNHHFVMTSSWEPQCHHDIIMRTPRITGKPKFSCSRGP